VEDAHRIERNETEEAHYILDPALNDSLPHGWIARNLVANDDQVQILVARIGGQSGSGDGERLHQPWDVLLRTDRASIQKERIVDLVALENPLSLEPFGFRAGGAGVGDAPVLKEFLAGGAVDQTNPLGRDAHQVLDVALGSGRDGDDPVGPKKAPAK